MYLNRVFDVMKWHHASRSNYVSSENLESLWKLGFANILNSVSDDSNSGYKYKDITKFFEDYNAVWEHQILNKTY